MSKLILDQAESAVRNFFNNIIPEGCHSRSLHIRCSCLHRPDTYWRQAQADPGHLRPEGRGSRSPAQAHQHTCHH